MTLDEAFAFGREVKSRHGSSSALGRYQIVGNTMRSAQAALGLPGTATFDAATQDRMARWIARNQGLGAWEGLKSNPGAMARAQSAMSRGGAKDVPGGGAVPPSTDGGDVLGRMRALRSSGSVINEQCVALAKAAVGVSGSVTEWRKGVGAEAGTLTPGTPVATFLNRDGSQSSRYAGSGTGTMGAGTDHAAVFQNYIRDKAGNITGMRVAEQYKGSGGVKSKDYSFGSGFGEKNASNYNAILGKTGDFLGGSANPMNRTSNAVAEESRKLRDVGDGIKSTGWRKAGEAGGLGSGPNAPAAPLGESAPIRNVNTLQSSGVSPAGGGGSSGSGAVIQINGHNGDPEALANAVQRRINEAMNRRSHDVDHVYS
ncbi:hypothetical protein MKK55_15880 [Methylobacterium sp. J-059]|uniref:hypothetical protein n=1 Tax=Methylobacterium sp. J-059 TaxID=2836643 RepID=UPI001FBBEE9D|nr:hypothetical protein [Methylobacterium sp. J-059]MCJ2040411.1 hypothetical protein [Methylobacterium sp. J-059]